MTQTPLVWEAGVPRSSLFGDIYYSLEDGLAETRAVFLAGCGLPDTWRGRDHFVVGELGFGTGLNIAALLQAWRTTREPNGRLHIFSIEAFPLPREDAARALGTWPELADEAQALLAAWPKGRRGFHRIDLPGFHAVLDLAILPVEEALSEWSGRADAWFLDGFSPALNPAMWTPKVMALVAARSAPGAVCATFTVAGSVRRGLEVAGFEVAKRPGHGRKLQRLEARLPGRRAEALTPSVAVIGAGIAGAALARAFEVQGVTARQFASGPPAASGNPVALVTPALDAGGGARADFNALAFARAVDLYAATRGAVVARRAVQKTLNDKDLPRFAAVAAQDIFDPGRVNLGTDGLVFEEGLVIYPAVVLAAWAGRSTDTAVTALKRASGGWRLTLADGGEAVFDTVVMAAGWGSAALLPGLDLSPVRGQVSWAQGQAPAIATSFGAYALPMESNCVLFGATHDRGVSETDVRQADHARNLTSLAEGLPDLAAALAGAALVGRAAVRVSTRDRMPMAGRVAPRLWALTGLGGRGFTTAPLLAEHIVAEILGLPSPLPARLAALVSPARPISQRR